MTNFTYADWSPITPPRTLLPHGGFTGELPATKDGVVFKRSSGIPRSAKKRKKNNIKRKATTRLKQLEIVRTNQLDIGIYLEAFHIGKYGTSRSNEC